MQGSAANTARSMKRIEELHSSSIVAGRKNHTENSDVWH